MDLLYEIEHVRNLAAKNSAFLIISEIKQHAFDKLRAYRVIWSCIFHIWQKSSGRMGMYCAARESFAGSLRNFYNFADTKPNGLGTAVVLRGLPLGKYIARIPRSPAVPIACTGICLDAIDAILYIKL